MKRFPCPLAFGQSGHPEIKFRMPNPLTQLLRCGKEHGFRGAKQWPVRDRRCRPREGGHPWKVETQRHGSARDARIRSYRFGTSSKRFRFFGFGGQGGHPKIKFRMTVRGEEFSLPSLICFSGFNRTFSVSAIIFFAYNGRCRLLRFPMMICRGSLLKLLKKIRPHDEALGTHNKKDWS
jgi:hypothetical protein